MAKKSGKSKSGLTIDQEQEILHMKPADLAVEAAREDAAIDKLKDQRNKDGKITSLQDQLKEHKDVLDSVDDIVAAKAKLDELKEANKTKDHLKVEEDLKAERQGWNNDIRQRSKKFKYMKKTLKKHMESGALKSKLD